MRHPKIKVGDVFSRLTVISGPTSHPCKSGTYLTWGCCCECGTEREVRTGCLNSGNTRSCGCSRIGHAVSPEARVKIGNGNRGKERSGEFRQRLSEYSRQFFARLSPEERAARAKLVSDAYAALPEEKRQAMKQRVLANGAKTRFAAGHKGYQHWLGKTRDPETVAKIAAGNRANPARFWKGKEFPEEMRRNMSRAMIGKCAGSKHWNWKGGTARAKREARNSVEWTTWRTIVYRRDSYTCQKCKRRGGKLSPHHILNWSTHVSSRFDPDNGITLCFADHTGFHRIYGNRNNTREQLKEFLGG